jgi:hypothetical protein
MAGEYDMEISTAQTKVLALKDKSPITAETVGLLKDKLVEQESGFLFK